MGGDSDRNLIERLSWDEVARRIADGAVAILPIGAAAKEHGFHLPMNTDRIQAEWLAAQIAGRIDALIWPTLTYGFYPAFVEYAGSSGLSAPVFEAMIHEIATGIIGFGCRALFVLDTGISTLAPVDRALARLDNGDVLHLRIHEGPRYRRAAAELAGQGHGSHADELETSLMLALAPDLVKMSRAEASPEVKHETPGRLTPTDISSPNYSRSGSYGDPTLATRAKGEVLLAAMVGDLIEQVTAFLAANKSIGRAQTSKRFQMKIVEGFRRIASAVVVALTLLGMFAPRADAQSELRGDRMPYDAFDKLPKTDIDVAGGVVHVAFGPGTIGLPKEKILDWVKTSAKAVATYYGRFPVSALRLLIVPVDGPRVRGGTTWGYRGAAIRVIMGRDSSEDDLRRDWVMVHEMTHLALPDMAQRYGWLSEGLAVYVEPIARVQAGDLTAKEIWQAMMRDMPKGLPQAGDEGLDNTDTWGRKYWGGAMFCLLADIEIRKATSNKFGLQDAMRGVIAAGGNHEVDWSIERILATADKAVGVDVLTRLHEKMGPKPVTPDLDSLWRDLGLRMQGENLVFDDTAPLAAIRKAITEARK